MITIQDIKKSYKKNVALDDVNMTLENKVYGLLGPNGSGKTTLLRIISGLLKADHGSIVFQDKSIQEASIGYLPQKFGVFKELSVYEQLEYYCILKKIHIKFDCLRTDVAESWMFKMSSTLSSTCSTM